MLMFTDAFIHSPLPKTMERTIFQLHVLMLRRLGFHNIIGFGSANCCICTFIQKHKRE